MKTIYEFEGTENSVLEVSNYVFSEIEKLLKDRVDYDGLIQDIRDKILELKGIMQSECYVPRHIANLLDKLGFNRGCTWIYDENGDLTLSNDIAFNSDLPENQVTAPTLQEAYRWLRETQNFHFDITTLKNLDGKVLYAVAIKDARDSGGFPVLKTYSGLGSQEESIILGLIWSLRYLVDQLSDNEE
jgi:hypothetical protein